MEQSTFHILLVDDSDAFRMYVSRMFEQYPQFGIVAEAKDGLQAVTVAEQLHPDLIVLDIGLPMMNGIDAARHILNRSPGIKILFLTAYDSTEIAREALRVGAQGYVVKAYVVPELIAAVEAVLGGKSFVSRGVGVNAPETNN